MANPAFVQVKSGTGTAVTSKAVTLDSAPTNGNTLVALIATDKTTTSRVTSISQTGVTWTRTTQVANGLGTTEEIWQGESVSGASATATVNFAASLKCHVWIYEFSGLVVPILDKTATDTVSEDGGGA